MRFTSLERTVSLLIAAGLLACGPTTATKPTAPPAVQPTAGTVATTEQAVGDFYRPKTGRILVGYPAGGAAAGGAGPPPRAGVARFLPPQDGPHRRRLRGGRCVRRARADRGASSASLYPRESERHR